MSNLTLMANMRTSLSKQMFSYILNEVTHVLLPQQTFSSSKGITRQTVHVHHSGISSWGWGSGGSLPLSPFGRSLANSSLPLPWLSNRRSILSLSWEASCSMNSQKQGKTNLANFSRNKILANRANYNMRLHLNEMILVKANMYSVG